MEGRATDRLTIREFLYATIGSVNTALRKNRKYGTVARVKTTIDIPDDLFRKAKATAALRGISMRQFVAEALRGKIQIPSEDSRANTPPWMRGFGALSDLSEETAHIQSLIDAEFEQIESDDVR